MIVIISTQYTTLTQNYSTIKYYNQLKNHHAVNTFNTKLYK